MPIITDDVGVGVEALRRGQLVAFPTETVYGLGADAASSTAVAAIFAAKGRPAGHPLIAHVAAVGQVEAWARLDDAGRGGSEEAGGLRRRVEALAEAFWPGPLTLILPRTPQAAPETTGGRPTIGLRIPDHPIAQALLARFGGAVAAPSANRFGRVSPTTAAHVVDDLGDLVDVVLDGGPTAVGIESTILELVGDRPTLLRPGAVSAAEIEAVLGEPVADGTGGASRASGMLRSHYAPRATVELVPASGLESLLAELTAPGAADRLPLVGVIATVAVDHQPSWLLPADAEGYAARLYGALRESDRLGVDRLLVVAPTEGSMVAAVLDRLTKAAAPRP